MLDVATTFVRKNGERWALVMRRYVGEPIWRDVTLHKVDERGIPIPKAWPGEPRKHTRLGVGWNGERLSECEYTWWLRRKTPDLHDQLIDYLRKHVPKRTD